MYRRFVITGILHSSNLLQRSESFLLAEGWPSPVVGGANFNGQGLECFMAVQLGPPPWRAMTHSSEISNLRSRR